MLKVERHRMQKKARSRMPSLSIAHNRYSITDILTGEFVLNLT